MVTKCPLCKHKLLLHKEKMIGAEVNKIYSKKFDIDDALKSSQLDFWKCLNCDLGFFFPIECGDESLYRKLQKFDWYYMEDKYEYQVALQYFYEEGTILEVGAGRATFSFFVDLNCYTGLELNEIAIQDASKQGVNILKETIEDHSAHGYQYDFIVSFQVLEHVASPSDFIENCINCLKPNGILIIAVPSQDGFVGKAVNNVLNVPPHHVTLWSEQTLRKLAPIYNLECIAIDHEPVADFHKQWARKVIAEYKIRKLFAMKPKIIDSSYRAWAISKLASLASILRMFSIDRYMGHTIVGVYKKRL